MQATNIPTKISIPFAQDGGKNVIPTASQISTSPGKASFTDGFPPATRTALAAGGIPPSGLDMNGILNASTAWARWAAAGGAVPYDAAFSAAIGGYPAGARLANAAVRFSYWVSLVDSNTTNPDAGGAGWVSSGPVFFGQTATFQTPGTFSWVCPVGVIRALVKRWGTAGGGASGTTGQGQPGGGGGGYSEQWHDVVQGNSYPIVVGTGGVGGISGANGAAGTATSAMGISVPGALGGVVNTAVGGTPGAGPAGGVSGGGSYGGQSNGIYGGPGGSGAMGSAGGCPASAGGQFGGYPGGGGSGGGGTGSGFQGGGGSNGLVTITY